MANELLKQLIQASSTETASWNNTLLLINNILFTGVQSFVPPEKSLSYEVIRVPHHLKPVAIKATEEEEQTGSLKMLESSYYALKQILLVLTDDNILMKTINITQRIGNVESAVPSLINSGIENADFNDLELFQFWNNVLIIGDKTAERKVDENKYIHELDLLFTEKPITLSVAIP